MRTSFVLQVTLLKDFEKCLEDRMLPSVAPAWFALDKEMRDAFRGVLEQYEQGLCHAHEMVEQLSSLYTQGTYS